MAIIYICHYGYTIDGKLMNVSAKYYLTVTSLTNLLVTAYLKKYSRI